MSINSEELNEKQKEAVEYHKGPLAIIAGAGTGKTRTITHKIAYFIQNNIYDPSRIIAITFTNKAANEMKQRIQDMIGVNAKVEIRTYHSLCLKILRKHIHNLNLPNNFNILDKYDQKQILAKAYKKFRINRKTHRFSNMLNYISKNKITKKSIKILEEEAYSDTDKVYVSIYKEYLEESKRMKSLDFDDLLLYTADLFDKFPKIKDHWVQQYDYLLVDEFQDTSLIQYEIIKELTPHNNVTIVGDPDQTIYSWRMADVNLILDFQKYFQDAKIIVLEENYRSTQSILDAANNLISYNNNRLKKDLFTKREQGSAVEFYHGYSDEAEVKWIHKKISQLRKQRYQLKDIAILYRSNYLSQHIEKKLINENINFTIFGSLNFYERREIKNAISFLKIINNGDEVSFRRMINIPAKKIGATTLEKLINFSINKKSFMLDALKNYYHELYGPKADPKYTIGRIAHQNLGTYIRLITKYQIALKEYPIHLVLRKFLYEVGFMHEFSKSEDEEEINNVRELINSIEYWEKKNPDKTLDDYLQETSLYTNMDEERVGNNYVSLMTVHAAKGLEFANVFICGFSEGIIPSEKSLVDIHSLEEERRVAYVAATRAKDNLFITDSRGYSIDGKMAKVPSRFLEEMKINVRKHHKSYTPPSQDGKEEVLLSPGDKVYHASFGDGVIREIEGDIATIAFKDPHGEKTLLKNHKSIEKVA